jgi:SHS2 domain-containing protein
VDLEAPDRPRLLADWLEELVFLAETEGFVVEQVDDVEASEQRLRAVLRGRPGEPRHLVKAVTYHRLAFEPADGGWRATVVFDV